MADDRFGRKQHQRAWGQAARPVLRRIAIGRRSHSKRLFGDMAVGGQQALDMLKPQPVAKARQQVGQIVLRLCAAGRNLLQGHGVCVGGA